MSYSNSFSFFLISFFFSIVFSKSSLSGLTPLEAVLFDVDGTLCDSDPLHHQAFSEILLEV